MIKTYEIHNSSSEDDDEMVEFDPEVVDNLNWWQRCFVPKYPIDGCRSGEDTFLEYRVPIETHEKGFKEERMEESSRSRFNSEDVTVSTNLTTPPGTPDIKRTVPISSSMHNVSNSCKNINISHNPSSSNDLETPSMRRNAISAIDEESEEVDKLSEDDKESAQVTDTTLSASK